MLNKHMLYRVANSIQTKWIKGKHIIELYPGFGLLSLRIMKAEFQIVSPYAAEAKVKNF